MASASSESDFRILLIGRTGHGKSSTGNTIVGENIFRVSEISKSQTKTCQWSKKFVRFGKTVEIVDTPGIFDTDLSHSDVQKELLKSLALTTPGFHAIAFVLMKGRFTEEIQKTQDIFFEWFGPGVEKFACIILTDTKDEATKKRYISVDPHEKLTQLVNICGGNVTALDNSASEEVKESQVKSLFQVVERIKRSNDGEHFTNVMFKLAESYVINKYPKELTMDSIIILENAGLKLEYSDHQCRYLDHVLSLSHEEESVNKRQSDRHSKEAETEMHATTQPTLAGLTVIDETSINFGANTVDANSTFGNLPIFDDSTNERIRNERKVQQPIESSSLSGATVTDTLADSQRSESFQVPGNTCPKNDMNSRALTEVTENNSIGESQEFGSDQSDYPGNRPKTGTRKNRKIDYKSVRYDIPESPVDAFKDKVNKGENSEQLNGFRGYLKKAWVYCKQKISKCTLL